MTDIPLVGTRDRGGRAQPTAGSVAGGWVMLATGVIMLAGTLVDFATLWIAQRQPTPQWEFVALSSTLDGMGRLVLGLAFLWLFLVFRGTKGMLGHRLLSVMLLVVGLASATLGLLMAMDYLTLRTAVTPEAAGAFKSAVIKALTLSVIYTGLLVPTGVLSLRKPRNR